LFLIQFHRFLLDSHDAMARKVIYVNRFHIMP
jgi:hypothetical protein